MLADQIRRAIDENWPVILRLGVLEYHSEHCCVGVDSVLVVRAAEALEQEMTLSSCRRSTTARAAMPLPFLSVTVL